MENTKRKLRIRRHGRVRAKIFGTSKVPRVSVFRSSRNIFVQFVDDATGKTVVSNTIKSSGKSKSAGTKTELAGKIGEALAKAATEAGISKIVFDRGGYKYHGRVKALAEGLRRGGLNF